MCSYLSLCILCLDGRREKKRAKNKMNFVYKREAEKVRWFLSQSFSRIKQSAKGN